MGGAYRGEDTKLERAVALKEGGRVILALSKWELANLHLPPATTVTLYSGTAPVESLRRRVTLPGFALVVSMNHTVGDGHTYYRLYAMLDADTEVEALDPIRVAGFEEARTDVIGEDESAFFTSAGLGLGIMGTYFLTQLPHRGPQNLCVHSIDPAWVAQAKATAKEEARVPLSFHQRCTDIVVLSRDQVRHQHHGGQLPKSRTLHRGFDR